MDTIRRVNKIVTGQHKTDGAGVRLVRVIGHQDVKDFDPFLMLDAFDSTDPEDYIKGFPWHPHRGIETVTYLIEGDIEHGDSLGNKGSILNGDCQWMTAGSGIIHQEMPKASKRMLGVQLWLNLPAKDKMATPKYGDITSNNVPVVEDENSKTYIISGTYKGQSGAFQGDYVKATFLDVDLKEDGEWLFETDEASNVFVYVISGKGSFDSNESDIDEKKAILFNKGNILKVKASNEGIRFLVFSGKPLNEPIAWGGPIVMNTKEELNLAFRELDEGTFIKTDKGVDVNTRENFYKD